MIGETIGILRAQSNLTSQQAFDMLVSASMGTNVKLRDVAREIAGRPPVP
jgi:AmiR/NasT family two-component response regulator